MDLAFAGVAFNLEAFIDGTLQEDFVFAKPVTMTIAYSEDDLVFLDEASLEVLFWGGSAWSAAGIMIVERDLANNRLVVTATHLSDFALFAEDLLSNKIFLPLVPKSSG